MMDLEMMVQNADPARTVELRGADSAEAARLYREITGRPAGHRAVLDRWPLARPLTGPTIAGMAAAGLTAAVAVAVAVAMGLPGGTAQGPGAVRGGSAAGVLEAAALTAAHGSAAGSTVGPGQYLYVKDIEVKGLSSDTVYACERTPFTRQVWVAPDGSGRQVGSYPAQCASWGFHQSYGKGGIPWWFYGDADAAGLPTDPAALEQAIVRLFEDGHARASATIVYAATFLNAGSPPALRAALYQVIEALPGVQNLGTVTDRLGRHGQGVGLVSFGIREELIFDPATSAVLEAQSVAVVPQRNGDAWMPAGTVMQYQVYVSEGVVNSVTATPAATPRAPAHAPASATPSPSPSGSASRSPSPSPSRSVSQSATAPTPAPAGTAR
jgi:hypothetical protein